MLLRLVALMLAIVMIGLAPQVVHAGSELPVEVVEVMTEIDELGDSTTVEPVLVAWPDRGASSALVSRAHRRGRAHTTLVFRPPRWFASR